MVGWTGWLGWDDEHIFEIMGTSMLRCLKIRKTRRGTTQRESFATIKGMFLGRIIMSSGMDYFIFEMWKHMRFFVMFQSS